MSKKNPFEDLDPEFKETVEAMSDEDIKKKISEVAINEHENRSAMKADMDLAEKKEIAKLAGEQYAEATKANRLRISYAYAVLESRGKA
jgi:hypothetical protein